jgi:hypothetical protein
LADIHSLFADIRRNIPIIGNIKRVRFAIKVCCPVPAIHTSVISELDKIVFAFAWYLLFAAITSLAMCRAIIPAFQIFDRTHFFFSPFQVFFKRFALVSLASCFISCQSNKRPIFDIIAYWLRLLKREKGNITIHVV